MTNTSNVLRKSPAMIPSRPATAKQIPLTIGLTKHVEPAAMAMARMRRNEARMLCSSTVIALNPLEIVTTRRSRGCDEGPRRRSETNGAAMMEATDITTSTPAITA